jgi:hypothetical protein
MTLLRRFETKLEIYKMQSENAILIQFKILAKTKKFYDFAPHMTNNPLPLS